MPQYIEYKKGAKYPKPDAEISFDLDSFSDAGYIFQPDEIVIDIDCLPIDTIKDLIKRFGIKTQTVWTDRGVHLYYKKPRGFDRVKGTIALGFPVEYKYRKGKVKSITIKRDGKVRTIENEGVREEFPEYFMPGKYHDLMGVGSGNRNNELYAHKSKIFTLDECKEILEFINYNLFDEPLPKKELDTISREETFTPEKGTESLVTDLVIKERDPHLYNGEVYYKDGDVYTQNQDQIRRIIYQYAPGMTTKFVDEILKQVNYRCPKIVDKNTEFVVKLNNGFLDQGEFYEFEYRGFTPYVINVDYNKDAKPVEVVDKYLDQITDNDAEYKEYILEMMANTLVTDKGLIRSIAKFYIMVGNGGNGKSTLLNILREILQPDNCGHLSLDEFKDEKYLNTLSDKLVNLGDDVENIPITEKTGKRLKNLSSADTIMIRSLYHDAVSAQFIATLIFTSNHVIKSFDKTYGLSRRITWLPVYGKPEKVERDFLSKITTPECLEYWVKLMVEAYERLYERQCMPECKVLDNYKKEYELENNNTLLFAKQLTDSYIDHKKPTKIYEEYSEWCKENGEKPLSRKVLNATILDKFGFEARPSSVEGVKCRVYMRKNTK